MQSQSNATQNNLPTSPLPIVGQYNVQRFRQFSPEDSANFYVVSGQNTKRPYAMYPTFGRHHITYLGVNRLIFSVEPRALFRTIDFWYVVVGNTIYRIDRFYNQVEISQGKFLTTNGNVFFAYLVVNTITFACFVDGQAIYVYREDTGIFSKVTDPNAPVNPTFIAAFGNRITVSVGNSSQFVLSVINLDGSAFDPATCFTISGQQVFAQENGIIRQMGVLNNTLYIFTDFTTGIWANTPAIFSGTGATFPWKKNTTYEWNFGMADPLSLSISFDRMAFLGKNSEGLLQVMSSSGGEPERISSKAVDTLFQRYANQTTGSPFLEGDADGFLYQYENTIFYRISAGKFNDFGILDLQNSANSIEYNFETKTWHRCIELNGERNRIQKHVFFNNKHLVTVNQEGTIYEMSGQFYENEIRNPAVDDPQDAEAYLRYPFRYERITPIISEDDYAEFETEYVEIDFVFGESNISQSSGPFPNAVFLIDEEPDIDGNPVFLVDEGSEPAFLLAEEGNTPELNSNFYINLFKPHVELYFSDDGGITFNPADVREFSQMGYYQWRMRWYQLGCSRNRCYKLIAVSPVPIVVLGGVMLTKRVSGGGN
jgi:hypothetical protein